MVRRLAELTGLQNQAETLVRVLMGLAMLLGSGSGQLLEYAQAPKAIDNLAIIIRSSTDPDSKAIATSIFANLVRHIYCLGKMVLHQLLSSSYSPQCSINPVHGRFEKWQNPPTGALYDERRLMQDRQFESRCNRKSKGCVRRQMIQAPEML